MRKVGGDYVRYFNRKHSRIGTLFNERYKAKPILEERYLLTCLRYIEDSMCSATLTDEELTVHRIGRGQTAKGDGVDSVPTPSPGTPSTAPAASVPQQAAARTSPPRSHS